MPAPLYKKGPHIIGLPAGGRGGHYSTIVERAAYCACGGPFQIIVPAGKDLTIVGGRGVGMLRMESVGLSAL